MLPTVRILTVQCPKCGGQMKYQWDGRTISSKKKRCVYCGRSFGLQQRIVAA